LISGAFPPLKCGVGDYTFHLASHLSEAGIEVVVITSKSAPDRHVSSGCGQGFRVHRRIKRWALSEVQVITNALQDERPDIIDIQYPSTMGRANRSVLANLVPLLARSSCPSGQVVTTLHEFSERRLRWRIRAAINLIFSYHIIAVTRFDHKLLSNICWLGQRVSYVPIGANILPTRASWESRDAIRASLGLNGDEPLLLYFGFVVPQKGVELLLRAFWELLDREWRIKLLLVADLDSENAYHRLIRKLIKQIDPLEKSIVLKGYVSSDLLSKYLVAADVGVFPYLEGASERRGSLLAALMHGLPVITTAPNARSDVPFVNQRDVLFASPDVGSLLEATERLLKSPDLRKSLAQGGRTLAQRFSWQRVAQEKLDVYDSLLRGETLP